MKNFRFIILYFFPVAIWMAVIFFLSDQPGLAARADMDVWFYVTRKGAHIFEYFILGILVIRLLRQTGLAVSSVVGYSVLFSFAWALSDEFHQLFIPGREGKLMDVAIDALGIFLAGTIFLIINKNRRSGF